MDFNGPCKDLLFLRDPNLAQKLLYLVGTVLKLLSGTWWAIFRCSAFCLFVCVSKVKSEDLRVVYLLLTFNRYCKLANSWVVIWIVIVGCAKHIPCPPVKRSPTLMTACYQQWTIAVVFKLRLVPGDYCCHLRSSDILVCGAIYNLRA